MIRRVVVAISGLLTALSPPVQILLLLALLSLVGLLAAVLFSRSERPAERLLLLVRALRGERPNTLGADQQPAIDVQSGPMGSPRA